MYCQICGHPTLCEICLDIAFDDNPVKLGIENLSPVVQTKKIDISSGEDSGLMAYFRSKHEGDSPTPSYVGQ